jgi:hypothetical protein
VGASFRDTAGRVADLLPSCNHPRGASSCRSMVSAGSPQGLLPGAPTDPGVRVEDAPGSSRCGVAVPHTIRSFRGDTLVRHGVLSVVPTPCPQCGAPFAPRGSKGPFPRFNTTMGRCDSLPSISPHFVSFAWRYHRSSPVRPHQLGTELWINLELVSRSSCRQSRWRRQGLPSSRGTLLIIRRVLRPRCDQAR